MNDFKTDIQYNIQLLKNQLRVDYNFDILYRNVIIGEHEAGFFFIDGFVQEYMIEKLIQF